MSGASCLTPASELRELLGEGRRHVIVTFKFYDTVYYRDVIVSSVQPIPDSGERVDCRFRNGSVISLLLPAVDDDSQTVQILDPIKGAILVIDANRPSLELLALETHLRLQEEIILWGPPEAVDDGPYARHPRLRDLPREVRDKIAAALTEGWPGSAALALLRHTKRSEMSVVDASALIKALQLYGEP